MCLERQETVELKIISAIRPTDYGLSEKQTHQNQIECCTKTGESSAVYSKCNQFSKGSVCSWITRVSESNWRNYQELRYTLWLHFSCSEESHKEQRWWRYHITQLQHSVRLLPPIQLSNVSSSTLRHYLVKANLDMTSKFHERRENCPKNVN